MLVLFLIPPKMCLFHADVIKMSLHCFCIRIVICFYYSFTYFLYFHCWSSHMVVFGLWLLSYTSIYYFFTSIISLHLYIYLFLPSSCRLRRMRFPHYIYYFSLFLITSLYILRPLFLAYMVIQLLFTFLFTIK